MSREWIAKQVEQFRHVLAEDESRLAQSPGNVFVRATVQNRREALADFTRQLGLIDAEEAAELVELRFIGPRADGGSMPLDVFIKVAEPLVKAWKMAAHRLRYGRETNRPSREIKDDLNLKIAGLAYGSTRIMLTGSGSADTVGVSLLQATLTQTFRLLNAESDSFYDAVDAVGIHAARNFGEAMKAISSAGLSADFVWHSPSGRQVWEGRSQEIDRVTALIGTVSEPENYQETIIGEIAGILDTGRLQVRTPDGKITIRFPLNEVHQVQGLAIRRGAALRVDTSRYYDASRKAHVYLRHLVGVVDLGKAIEGVRTESVASYDDSFFTKLLQGAHQQKPSTPLALPPPKDESSD